MRSLYQALVGDVRSGHGLRRSDPGRLRWKRDRTCPRYDRRRDHAVPTTGIITGPVQQKQAKRTRHGHGGSDGHGSQIFLVLGHGDRSSPECPRGDRIGPQRLSFDYRPTHRTHFAEEGAKTANVRSHTFELSHRAMCTSRQAGARDNPSFNRFGIVCGAAQVWQVVWRNRD